MQYIHWIYILIIFVTKLLFLIEGKIAFYNIKDFKIESLRSDDSDITFCKTDQIDICIRNVTILINKRILQFGDLTETKSLILETDESLQISSTMTYSYNATESFISTSEYSDSLDISTNKINLNFSPKKFVVTVNVKIECQNGYLKPSCTNIDICNRMPPNVCRNNGTCNPDQDSMKCNCSPGFKGEYCDEVVDPCQKNLCGSHSSCRADNGSPIKYSCDCKFGYGGHFCLDYKDPCVDHFCANNATCVHNSSDHLNYSCHCSPGFSGPFCAHTIDNCAANSSMCSQYVNATCISTRLSHVCYCNTLCMRHSDVTAAPLFPLPFKWPFSEIITFIFVSIEALVILVLIIIIILMKTNCCRRDPKHSKSYIDDNLLIKDVKSSNKESIEFGSNYGRQPIILDDGENRNSLNPLFDIQEMQTFSNNQLNMENNGMSTFGRR